MTSLAGRNVIVVGASSGIGRKLAVGAAETGARVVLVARRRERLEEVLTSCPGGAALEADVADPTACRMVVERSAAIFGGGTDLIVFAVGVSRLQLVADTAASEWDVVLRTNLVGPAVIAGHATAHMAQRGVMAFLSSVVVGDPYRGLVPYGVSKAGLEELVRGLRVEHPGLRFTTLRIGGTLGTEFTRDYDPGLARALSPHWIASGALPAQNMHVDDVGTLVVDLLSDLVNRPSLDCHQVVLTPAGPSLSIARLMTDAEPERRTRTTEENSWST